MGSASVQADGIQERTFLSWLRLWDAALYTAVNLSGVSRIENESFYFFVLINRSGDTQFFCAVENGGDDDEQNQHGDLITDGRQSYRAQAEQRADDVH